MGSFVLGILGLVVNAVLVLKAGLTIGSFFCRFPVLLLFTEAADEDEVESPDNFGDGGRGRVTRSCSGGGCS